MFAIYDRAGRSFRNNLEQLQKVRPITNSPYLNDEEKQLGYFITQPAGELVSLKAREAYREVMHFSKREAIVHAYQVMSSPVESVALTMDIASALKRIREQQHQLPVLDNRRRIVGMLSDREVLQFLINNTDKMNPLKGITVENVMSGEVITTDPVSDIRRIATVMLEYRLNAIPVVDERDTLIGIVSSSNILQAITQDPPISMWS